MSLSSNFVNSAVRLAIYKKHDFKCAFCGKKLKRDYNNLTLDHVKPRSKNGSHNTHNLVLACHSCNSSKQDKSVWDFCLEKDFNFLEVDQRIRENTSKPIDSYLSLAMDLLDVMDYKTALKVI